MLKTCNLLCLVGLFALGIAVAGCSKSKPSAEKPAAPATEAGATALQEPAPSDLSDEWAELSVADRAAALAQKTCPVSGEALGEMGTPIKVSVSGRDVFICCPSCKEPLLKEPEKYLAKLDAK